MNPNSIKYYADNFILICITIFMVKKYVNRNRNNVYNICILFLKIQRLQRQRDVLNRKTVELLQRKLEHANFALEQHRLNHSLKCEIDNIKLERVEQDLKIALNERDVLHSKTNLLTATLADTKSEVNKVLRERNEVGHEISNLKGLVNNLKSQCDTDQNELNTLKQTRENMVRYFRCDLELRKESATRDDEVKKEFVELKEKAGKLEIKFDAAKRKISHLTTELDQARIIQTETERRAEKKRSQVGVEISKLKELLNTLQTKYNTSEIEIKNLKHKRQNMVQYYRCELRKESKAKDDNEKTLQEFEELKSETHKLQREHEAAKRKISRLTVELDLARAIKFNMDRICFDFHTTKDKYHRTVDMFRRHEKSQNIFRMKLMDLFQARIMDAKRESQYFQLELRRSIFHNTQLAREVERLQQKRA